MTKYLYLIVLIASFHLFGISQNNIDFIDKIADNVCKELQNNDTIYSLHNYEFYSILRNSAVSYKEDWYNELEKIGKPHEDSLTGLDGLLYHRMLQTCEQFRELYMRTELREIPEEKYKKIFKTINEFVLNAESDIDPEKLVPYLSEELKTTKSVEKIRLLQNELDKYKKTSCFYFKNYDRKNQLEYYISFYDYRTGDDNFAIIILFKDTNDSLIDDWNFVTKEQLDQTKESDKKGNKILEELIKDIPKPVIDSL